MNEQEYADLTSRDRIIIADDWRIVGFTFDAPRVLLPMETAHHLPLRGLHGRVITWDQDGNILVEIDEMPGLSLKAHRFWCHHLKIEREQEA